MARTLDPWYRKEMDPDTTCAATTADHETLSKFLSFVLRHRPDSVGVRLDREGWVDVDVLLAGIEAAGGQSLTLPTLLEIVGSDAKTRYALSPDGRRIRANQGHSHRARVAPRHPTATPPTCLFHGTKEASVPAIVKKGLLPMTRVDVHLSADADTAQAVGDRRSGRTVVISVDAKAMLADKLRFRRSENGVWLVGAVPPRYLSFPS